MKTESASPAAKKRAPRQDTVLAWVGLFGLWVVLSGKLTPFHLSLGLATVLTLVWLQRSLPPFRREEAPGIRPWRLLPYFFWVSKEMVVSAIYVGRVILRPEAHLDPKLIRFEAEQPTLLNAVIFAHSITLTPGTITLDLDEDRYLVHALTPVTAQGVLEGSMARRVARLSTDAPVKPPRLIPLPESELP
jgi:multicomponent Na+:H+ antiporter subunit E